MSTDLKVTTIVTIFYFAVFYALIAR